MDSNNPLVTVEGLVMLSIAFIFDITEFLLDIIGTPLQIIIVGFGITAISTILDLMALIFFSIWGFVRYGDKNVESKKSAARKQEKGPDIINEKGEKIKDSGKFITSDGKRAKKSNKMMGSDGKAHKINKKWISKSNMIFEVLGIGAISSMWPGWIIYVYSKIKNG